MAQLTVFSLHPVKQLTTGEGGLVTTNDDDLARNLRRFRNHGISSDARQREAQGSWVYDVEELGYNYRLTDLQAALGRAQLRRLPAWLERRAAIADSYSRAFADLGAIEVPATLPDRTSSWHLYPVRLRHGALSADRATMFRSLRAEGIGVNVHYIPVPRHSYYRALGAVSTDFPVAEDAYERLLTLPLWAGMSDADVQDVIIAVRKVCQAYRSAG